MRISPEKLNKLIHWLVLSLFLVSLLPAVTPVAAFGEAATQFGVYVPPSGATSKEPALIVTALQDNTLVDIMDVSTDDNDSDDSHMGLALNAGQTHITLISEGAFNDNATGTAAKKDGDFFRITANRPVVVAHLTLNTDGQHSFVPSDNHRMGGTSFFLYRPPGYSGSSNTNDLLNIFAYDNNTEVKIIDITAAAKTTSGLTTVVPDSQGITKLSFTLQTGQDMVESAGQKTALDPGHTYHILSSKDVTVMFGAIGKNISPSRDGGDYVPGMSGYTADKEFYFAIPYAHETERELRLVSYARPANVTLRGWNKTSQTWSTVGTYALPVYGHVTLIGDALGSGNYLFEVSSDATVSVFESNWLETGTSGNADMSTFISAEDGTQVGSYFQAYLAPPTSQPDNTKQTHLVVSAYDAAQVKVYDSDSFGEYIELYNASNQTINLGGWTLKNDDGWGLTLPAGLSVGVNQTFLLQYHAKTTTANAGFVYGSVYPKFKLGNAHDTLVLSNPTGTYSDTLSYTDVGWFSHGVYHSLERKNPNLPFAPGNAQDSLVANQRSNNNLGDFFGTPAVQQGSAGNGAGNLVINEVMSGRIYRSLSINPDYYARIDFSQAEWEGINNGEAAGTNTSNPENPYLIVESNAPISVMDSNWKNNWSTYSYGTLQPDPAISYAADFYQREPGQTVVLTAYAQNHFIALQNPVTSISLPAGLVYTPGSYVTPQQLAGVIPTEVQQPDGSWLITWTHNRSMPVNVLYQFEVSAVMGSALPAETLLQSTTRLSGSDPVGGGTYSSQDSLVITVGASQPTALSDVVLNEISPRPTCGEEWVELHNHSTSAIDLSSWEISSETGFIYRFPAQTFIPNNGYLTLHLGSGTDTATDLYIGADSVANMYTGQDYAGAQGDLEGRVALYSGSTHNSTTLVDFVQWDDNGQFAYPNADTLAASAGQWTKGDYVPSPDPGATLGRDRFSTDNNTSGDWDNSGGIDAAAPTLGALNVTLPGVDTIPPGPVTNLTAVPVAGQQGAVQLNWTNPPSGDFAGVRVIRSQSSLPASLSDGQEVYNGIGQSFTDSSVPAGSPAFYTLFPYDDSGNTACVVPSSQSAAMPPTRSHLVFEDLKGNGWVDWDTNDLVVSEDVDVLLSGSNIAQILVSFEAEARGSMYNHRLNLSMGVSGGAQVQVERYDTTGSLVATEPSSQQDFVDVVVFDSSKQAIPGNHPNGSANTMAGTPFQQGGKVRITITLDNPSANPLSSADLPPYDPWIEVVDTGERIHLMQAGGIGNSQTVVDTNSQLYGRDLPLALDFNQAWTWPIETHPVWEAYPLYTTYITSGGTMAKDWYNYPNPGALWFPTPASLAPAVITPRNTSSPALLDTWPLKASGQIASSLLMADVNLDGSIELLATSMDGYLNIWGADGQPLPGWPQRVGLSSRSSPAVGDIDGDGQPEIVAGSDSLDLYAWHANGALAAGFPVSVTGSIKSAPVLAELDGNPGLEIVFATTASQVYILNGNGTAFSGWPQATGGEAESYGSQILASTPAVGDLNGDGTPEIVVGSTDGKVYAWQLNGSPVSRFWPRATHDWVYASPVIVDLNRDGIRDVVAASGDGRLYAWDGNGFDLPGFPVRVRGGLLASPAVIDLDGNSDLEVIFASLEGKVYAVHHDGSMVAGWPRTTGANIFSSPSAGDLDGDGDPEVLVGTLAGQVYAWHHDGIPVVDYPRQASDWITGAPALGDLDSDGLVEVAVGSYDGQVYIWKESGNWSAQHSPWPAFHGGPEHTGFVETDVPIQPLPAIRSIYMPVLEKVYQPAQ